MTDFLIRNTPLVDVGFFYTRVFLSSNSETLSSILAFSDEVAGPSTWWADNHHEYFFLIPSKIGYSAACFVQSRPASSSSIFPTFCPTSSMTLSIQLKGETTRWKRVPQKAVSTHTQQPLYLTMMATLKKIATTSPQASVLPIPSVGVT
jgi:hypothetical protein